MNCGNEVAENEGEKKKGILAMELPDEMPEGGVAKRKK